MYLCLFDVRPVEGGRKPSFPSCSWVGTVGSSPFLSSFWLFCFLVCFIVTKALKARTLYTILFPTYYSAYEEEHKQKRTSFVANVYVRLSVCESKKNKKKYHWYIGPRMYCSSITLSYVLGHCI